MGARPSQQLTGGEEMSDTDMVRAVFEASYRRLVGQLYGVCGDLTEAEEGGPSCVSITRRRGCARSRST
jgi:hypothetical protein